MTQTDQITSNKSLADGAGHTFFELADVFLGLSVREKWIDSEPAADFGASFARVTGHETNADFFRSGKSNVMEIAGGQMEFSPDQIDFCICCGYA